MGGGWGRKELRGSQPEVSAGLGGSPWEATPDPPKNPCGEVVRRGGEKTP